MPFSFGIKDVIDIFLVALILYYLYRLMKESRSLNIFIGVMVFVLVWLFVSQVLEMRLLGSILDKLVGVGAIALIVLSKKKSVVSSTHSVHISALNNSVGSLDSVGMGRVARQLVR